MNYTTALSMEEIQMRAPSAFAGQAYEKQSLNRYTFIPTSEVISGMMDSGFVPVTASQSRTKIQGKELFTKHMIRFRDERALGQRAIVGNTVLEAILINSHDGTSAYKLMLGLFRFICENGMAVSDLEFTSIHIRHTGNILSQVLEGSQRLFSEGSKVLDVVGKWQGIELDSTHQLALAMAARRVRFAENSPVPAESLLEARRPADQGNDLWSTFNRIQENATRGYRLSRPVLNASGLRRTRTVQPLTGIDQNIGVNQDLWGAASKLADLLTA